MFTLKRPSEQTLKGALGTETSDHTAEVVEMRAPETLICVDPATKNEDSGQRTRCTATKPAGFYNDTSKCAKCTTPAKKSTEYLPEPSDVADSTVEAPEPSENSGRDDSQEEELLLNSSEQAVDLDTPPSHVEVPVPTVQLDEQGRSINISDDTSLRTVFSEGPAQIDLESVLRDHYSEDPFNRHSYPHYNKEESFCGHYAPCSGCQGRGNGRSSHHGQLLCVMSDQGRNF